MRLLGTAVLALLVSSLHPASAQMSFEQQLAQGRHATAGPLDINTASPQQLNALPGFGPAYTRRVIEGRPYSAKNQLVTRGVIPTGAYERVSSLIVAHRTPPASGTSNPHAPK